MAAAKRAGAGANWRLLRRLGKPQMHTNVRAVTTTETVHKREFRDALSGVNTASSSTSVGTRAPGASATLWNHRPSSVFITEAMKGAPMAAKESDRRTTQAVREKLRKAERGKAVDAEELGRMGKVDDSSAASVEQEASDGPEGRGLNR